MTNIPQNPVTWNRHFITLISSICQSSGKRQLVLCSTCLGPWLRRLSWLGMTQKLRAGILQFGRLALKMSSPVTYLLPRLAQQKNSSPDCDRSTAAMGRPDSRRRLSVWLSVTYPWRSESIALILLLDPSRHNLSRFKGRDTDPTARWKRKQGFVVTFKPTIDAFACVVLIETVKENCCFSFIAEKIKLQRS